MREYNVTGYAHGIIVFASCLRKAKNIFRKSYPKEKIFYGKLAGRIRPNRIY